MRSESVPENQADGQRRGEHPARDSRPGTVKPVFSCVLLGEEPLAAHCGDYLLEQGHRIVGVIAASAAVRQWAKSRELLLVDRKAYPSWLAQQSFDLLLSITHPNLIAPVDIARARVAALNYHDGPLPRYAGMNGSAWALASGERHHAIVWHKLTAGLDEGEIVEWRDIALDPRETSLSLNMQSSALALNGFVSLITRLEQNDCRGAPQNAQVERLVFSRHDRPEALCTLDFGKTAEQLDCLIRACDFGPYPNRFGVAKVLGPKGALLALEAASTLSRGAIGEVLGSDGEGLEIACAAGALRIKRWATLVGTPVAPSDAAEHLGVRVGDRLLDDTRRKRAELSRGIAEAEPFFVNALEARTPLTLPFEIREQPVTNVPLRLPEAFTERYASDLEGAAAALFAVVLSSLCLRDTFDVALVDAAARAPLRAVEPLLYPSVPFRVELDPGLGFDALVSSLAAARARLAKRGAFLSDLVARHPEFARDLELKSGALSPAAVVLGGQAIPKGTALALRAGAGQVELASDGWLDAGRLEAIAENVLAVADAVLGAPERRLSKISLLTPDRHQTQVVAWNDKQRAFPTHLRLHDNFEARVQADPGAIALVFEGRQLTFAEVERGSNRIANSLQARGVRAGERVGLYVQRGFDLVLAMLGVAKSGAAYVPLDTAYPEDRVKFMLDDAGCRIVLCSSELCERARDRIAIDVAGPEVRGASEARPRCPASAEDECYTIYTSGSTGRPKGVVLTHKAVINTLDWVNRTLAVGPSDRLLFVTSPSFDLSVYDVFGALGAGASVEIASAGLLADPVELARRLLEPGITIWDSAPPALARLAPFLAVASAESTLRLVMLSGDWIPVWLPGLLQQRFEGVKIHSFGGATEAAIWSNHYPVEHVSPSWTSIPYGYPIQNCRYYVLDHHYRPLPVGVTGDLYIAGVCLAQGYLNREELTAERFIRDPFVPGERMYKTGDLARYWPDSTLEFLGRADSQVKIRGFRVELGEIETALTQLPNVRDAVCTVYLDASEQKSLVAYVVPKTGAELTERALRAELGQGLPDFMLPSHFIVLPHLPLSPNGKVDRKALPSPSGRFGAEPPVPPRTEAEKELVQIWQSLLQKQTVGVRDDFFAIGGHSLLAVMLITRIKQQFEVDLPLSRVLERPTIEALAQSLVEAAEQPPAVRHLVALNPRGSRPPIVMVAGIGGYAFTFQKFGNLFGADQPLYALQSVGVEGQGEVVQHTMEEAAEIHAAELVRERPTGPIIVAGFSFGALGAFALAVELRRQGRQVPLIISFDGFAPGYPAILPWPTRLKAHLLEVQSLSPAERKSYVKQRVHNLQSRFLHAIGRGAEMAPETPFADAEMSERLKNSWANHMLARRRYRPDQVLDCAVFLIRAEIPERWAATTIEDPLYGWQNRVTGPVTAVQVPGDHAAVMQLDNQDMIVDAIVKRIDQWLATVAVQN
jgi:amino acid adenylation domain-containing protein